ncbi:MAG: SpoIIE family protein phosphatase [Planctomycetes bacterium]|nr:SpoIIE family protein phosphatase [Planctomycetota bacterium]
MAVFGRQARARRRVSEGLQGSASWQVLAGKAWVCPMCAQVAQDAFPDALDARIDAALEHLEGSCPGWKGGEGAEKPLADVRKAAAVRDLRRRVKTELVRSPSWQLIDSTRQWYCPYCGEGTGVVVPADRRMTEDVLMTIVGHVEGCYAHRHGQQEKPLAHLKGIVKFSNQARRLAENVRKKLEGDPAWRRKDARSRWVCPYCLQAQEHIDLSSNLLMFENAPRLIARHLAAGCAEFKAGAQPKPLDAPERPPPSLQPSKAAEPVSEVGSGAARVLDTGSHGTRGGRLPSGRTPAVTGAIAGAAGRKDPHAPIPDTDPSGVAQRRREGAPPQPQQAGRPSARLPAQGDGRLAVPVDSGKLPALAPSDTGKLQQDDTARWGRDALFAGKGTTLRDLESSGELLLIDDPEVRRITARAAELDPREGSSGGGGGPRPSTARRPAHEWRKEIEQELARVRSLAPGGSGEHASPFGPGDPGGEDELRALARTLRLTERGVDVRRLLLPASPPRGDWVDLVDLGGDQLGLLAGGVLGDEPEGPLLAAMARNLARQALVRDADPRDVLRRVNAELFPDLDGRVFVGALCGLIDLQRLTLRVARAGLSSPLLVNPARQGGFGVLHTEGMVMGIDRGPIFDGALEARSFELARGDLLVLFTNGLLDARGAAAREEFGLERMHTLTRRYGGHEVEYFTDKFKEYFDLFVADPALRTTDVAVAAVKWVP